MSNFKFVLNRAGVRELLKGAEMRAVVERSTRNIYNALDPSLGFAMEVKDAGSRVRGVVYPNTPHAAFANREYQLLDKAKARGKV